MFLRTGQFGSVHHEVMDHLEKMSKPHSLFSDLVKLALCMIMKTITSMSYHQIKIGER